MKRNRIDGQLSKEEYDEQEDKNDGYELGSFAKATPNTLASRRRVAAMRFDKKSLFASHIKVLNASFHKWWKEQILTDGAAVFDDASQDYIDHASQLEDRYLRSYGEVLTFGSGDCAQLAHGMNEDEDLMVKYPRIVYSLRDKKVCAISCGGLHNAILTEQGCVYTWGCSDDGTLGRIGEESIPLLVDALKDEICIAVACGDGQTMAVSTRGEVWGWGCYKDKEGKTFFNPSKSAPNQILDIKKSQKEPICIQGLANVVDVVCGSAFNLARCSDGSLYSWGLGECGELGRKVSSLKKGETYDYTSIHRDHITPGFMYKEEYNSNGSNLIVVRDAKVIGCGAYHSMIITQNGSLMVCGLNNYAQLGLGGTKDTNTLTVVTALENDNIVSVKGGVHHSLVLTKQGRMFAFGRGDSSQLGVKSIAEDGAGGFSDVPVEPVLPKDVEIVAIACGGNHNLALTSTNDVYTWGYGDMLALGHGFEKDEPLPKKLNFTKAKIGSINVTQLAGGGQHSAIIGKVLST